MSRLIRLFVAVSFVIVNGCTNSSSSHSSVGSATHAQKMQTKWAEETRQRKAEFKKRFEIVQITLEKAEKFELFSLNPFSSQEEKKTNPTFVGGIVLGKIEIKDLEVRKRLVDALKKGFEENLEREAIANCFDPRHGIAATYGGKVMLLTICFECSQVKVTGDNDFLTTGSPQPVFDQVLREAKVPVADPPK